MTRIKNLFHDFVEILYVWLVDYMTATGAILWDSAPRQGNSQQNMVQQNAMMRAALLATAPKMSKHIGTFNGGNIGQTFRQKLTNVGLLTQLRLRIQCPVTIGIAQAVASLKAPYNLIQRLKVTDYDSTDHVNVSGHQLFCVNNFRNQAPCDRNNEGMPAVITQPFTPTQIGNGTIDFWVIVPIAFDPANDLRGCMLLQTAVGDSFVSIDWNPILFGVNNGDSVYQGAGATTAIQTVGTQITVDVWQDFLLPQALDTKGNIPIPPLDLRTVYELAGMVTDSTNLSLNNQKLIQYPNLRAVIGAYFSYVTNGQLSAVGNVGNMQLIANANNTIWDETEISQLFRQRRYINGDTLPGVYAFMHRDIPIQTALYGNIQFGMTPAVAPAGTNYVEYTFESFYAKGMALPGINQG